MTKIITRYFATTSQARRALTELVRQNRVSPRIIDLYESADGLEEALTKQKVEAATATAYAEKMAGGGAVLLVRAGYVPLSVGRITRDVAREMGAVDMGDLVEQVEVPDEKPSRRLSVLSGQPLMMSRGIDHRMYNPHQADWPIPLISRRKPFTYSVIPDHGRMASWPIGLLAPKEVRYGKFPFGLLVPHEKRYGKFPFDLLLPGSKRYGKFPFGYLVPHAKRYGKFPFDLLAPHNVRYGKFPFGFLVKGGRRMANWPFPLLLNGKTQTNSLAPEKIRYGKFPFDLLLPGTKRYGKFPFGYLVPHKTRYGRFPFGLLAPHNVRYGKFPFDLLLPGNKRYGRAPFDYLVPGHKYMANWILPHTKPKAS